MQLLSEVIPLPGRYQYNYTKLRPLIFARIEHLSALEQSTLLITHLVPDRRLPAPLAHLILEYATPDLKPLSPRSFRRVLRQPITQAEGKPAANQNISETRSNINLSSSSDEAKGTPRIFSPFEQDETPNQTVAPPNPRGFFSQGASSSSGTSASSFSNSLQTEKNNTEKITAPHKRD